MTYDEETKRKALEMIEQGMSLRTIAQKLNVSHTIVAKWKAERLDRLDQKKKTFPEVVYDERGNVSRKAPQPMAPPSTTMRTEDLLKIYEGLYKDQIELSNRFDDLQENLSFENRFTKLEKQLAKLGQKVEDLYRLSMGKNKTE